MKIQDVRTKTEFVKKESCRVKNVWEIALDIGYSSVKYFSPLSYGCFPSYAKRIDDNFQYAASAPEHSIMFKDLNTNEMWLIGEVAQNLMEIGDTSDSEASLYSRERYANSMFDVYVATGLGLGMLYATDYEKIVVQTGLPERYMNDQSDLKDVISGNHKIALRIGSGKWTTLDFTIDYNNIDIMPQPKGTLFSVCIDKNGNFTDKANDYLSSSSLVFDPGFGTLDLFPIIGGTVKNGETYSDLGMKRVLQETSKLINENWNIDIPVPAMQKFLETGKVTHIDKKAFKTVEYDFSELFMKSCESVCEEAIQRSASVYNHFFDFKYMIITGGTGAAWEKYIKDRLKGMSTLNIICGNCNEELPMIYSNVRGYYYYRYKKLNRG